MTICTSVEYGPLAAAQADRDVARAQRWRRRALAPFAVSVAAILTGCNTTTAASGPQATLYLNGDILTMEGDAPTYVDALVEKGGKIVFTGPRDQALKQFPEANRRDLAGRTLLPGFIDSHGHVYLTGMLFSAANVMPAPDGPGADYDALVRTTRAWMESPQGKKMIATFGWVIANGYDHSLMPEGVPPTAAVLDKITTDYPVLMMHQSGHMASLNTRALKEVGITRDTKAAPGGVIQRNPDGSPSGVIEEGTLLGVSSQVLGKSDQATDAMFIEYGQQLYLKNGFTTAEEARAFENISAALERAANAKKLRLDLIAYPDIMVNAAAMASPFRTADGSYVNNYRIGGVKISLDGSPQAKTAWLTHPYYVAPPNVEPGYKGYPAMTDAKAMEMFGLAARNKWQILCHANGDAAIDQCMNGMQHGLSITPGRDHRSVVIHAQVTRKDQLTRLNTLKGIPSFFTAHTFYWGDFHRDSVLGPAKGPNISPTRDALNAGLLVTTHHDAPAIPPDAMRVLDSTVNRITRSGVVLGPQQRLTPYEALKTLTSAGAYQHFEEASKGTLTVGKRADLVVLGANPLKVKPETIKSIRVVATIKDGVAVYCDPAASKAAICEAETAKSTKK
jgi:predicted amidohydrolase YtcJ